MVQLANLSFLIEIRDHEPSVDATDPVTGINTTMMCMCIFSAVLSIIGNVLVITVLLRSIHRHASISSYKINLAIADLGIIIVFYVPFSSSQAQMGHWMFGGVLCPLVLFLQLFCVCSSAYTNVAIGLDRFLAVMYPLESKPHIKHRLLMIVLVWVLAASIACPVLVVSKSEETGNFSQPTCKQCWTTQSAKQIYTLTVFVLLFILPTLFLTFTYSCVVYTLWSRDTPGNAHAERDKRRLASKKRITRMLMFVVVLFVTCWLPLNVLNLMVDVVPHLLGSLNGHSLDYLYFSCHWIGVSHAFVNPIIYVTTDSEFRTNLWQLLTLKTVTSRLSISGSAYASVKQVSRTLSNTNSRFGTVSSPISRNELFSFDMGTDIPEHPGTAFLHRNSLQTEMSEIRKTVSSPDVNFLTQNERSAGYRSFRDQTRRKIRSECLSTNVPVIHEISEDTEMADVFYTCEEEKNFNYYSTSV